VAPAQAEEEPLELAAGEIGLALQIRFIDQPKDRARGAQLADEEREGRRDGDPGACARDG
jgi:hypothetical protein